MVLELEGVVQSKAVKLCSLVTQKLSVGKAVDLHHAFRAVSIDVITEYGFNKCYDLLDEPDLGRHFFLMVRGIGPSLWVYRQWPELQIANSLPPGILKWMSPELAQVLNLQEVESLFQERSRQQETITDFNTSSMPKTRS